MVTPRRRGTLEAVLAVAALIGSVLMWSQSHRAVPVEPIADGQPSTVSVVYDPPLLLLTLLFATVAGILVAVGVARLRRSARGGDVSGADVRPTRQ